jgi:hypothetical protein
MNVLFHNSPGVSAPSRLPQCVAYLKNIQTLLGLYVASISFGDLDLQDQSLGFLEKGTIDDDKET